jgi:ribosome biogenesis protein Nip4
LAEETNEESETEEVLFNVNTKLKDEIDSWTPFLESLKFEDRELFKEMIQKSWDYADSVEVCSEEHITEAFLISLLVSQQKKINFLENQVEINFHDKMKGES